MRTRYNPTLHLKAFTLIELLVVVAVLALLASIVFSNLGGAREGARISNALSFQSQTHSLLGSDLVGWWNFNEGSGTTAGDISGYDNNGTIYGATHVDGVPGTLGSALIFDGANDYVGLGNGLSGVFSADRFTLSTWINNAGWVDHGASWNAPLGWGAIGGTADQINVGFRLSNTNNITATISDGPNILTQLSDITATDEWHHYVITVDSDFRLYVDGVQTGSDQNWSGDIDSTQNMFFGRDVRSNRWFNGILDDSRIYSRALTSGEINKIYAETKHRYLTENKE